MRREISELVSSSFQEIFNWEKAWQSKNNNQNNAFCLPFFGFFTKSSQYQIWKANPYSILTNGNQAWTARLESLTRISNFMTPVILNTNFIKWESKIGYPWISNWHLSDCKPTAVITTTPCLTYSMMGSLKLLCIYPQRLGKILYNL